MAASSTSSDESNAAPTDFNISSSLESSNGKNSVIYEKCTLCLQSRRAFFCPECIRNGNFTHSKARYPERFAEKKLRLIQINKNKSELEESIRKRIDARCKLAIKKREIQECKARIELLSQAVCAVKDDIQKAKDESSRLIQESLEIEERKKEHPEKVQQEREWIERFQQSIAKKQTELLKVKQDLKEVIQKNVQQLITYIFPISDSPNSPGDEDSSKGDELSELEEAQHTTYIRGRWVFTSNSRDVHYKIVEPSLPSNGIYSAYNNWVQQHQDSMSPTPVQKNPRNPGYTISAALMYVTQLVSVLAYFLDVRLPHNLCYSEFCGHELTEDQFTHKVAKLNANIVHLCVSQNVDPSLITPRHTIKNLLLLLNPQVADLGRFEAFEMSPELISSVDDSLSHDLSLIDDSVHNQNSDEEEEAGEWETVPNLPNIESLPYTSRASYSTTVLSRQASQAQSTSSLFSSAAALVTQFWKPAQK